MSRNFMCNSCCVSKFHKLPFFKSFNSTTKPLELIHLDLWGPSHILSHFKFSFYIIFIDDYSKYTLLYPLKLKTDVFNTFLEYQNRVEK